MVVQRKNKRGLNCRFIHVLARIYDTRMLARATQIAVINKSSYVHIGSHVRCLGFISHEYQTKRVRSK